MSAHPLFAKLFTFGYGSDYPTYYIMLPKPELNPTERDIAFQIFLDLKETITYSTHGFYISVVYMNESIKSFEFEYPSEYEREIIEMIEDYAKKSFSLKSGT